MPGSVGRQADGDGLLDGRHALKAWGDIQLEIEAQQAEASAC